MAGPVSERGDYLWAYQFGGSYQTPGHTVTDDNLVAPGPMIVHTGLARAAAADSAVGIVEIRFTERDGQSRTILFGSHADWETAVYKDKLSFYTVGLHVARGVAKGWWFHQVWG